MFRRTVSFLYVLNIVFQALFSLLFAIGVALLLGWVSTTYWSWPSWVYVPLILFGVVVGMISMVRFIISASRGLDNLERQHARDSAEEQGEQNKR